MSFMLNSAGGHVGIPSNANVLVLAAIQALPC